MLADLCKSDKEFVSDPFDRSIRSNALLSVQLTKNIDNEVSRSFKEFRNSEVARSYYSPFAPTGPSSILNSAIEDLITIHDHIDEERRKWFERFRKVSEQAKEKQACTASASSPADHGVSPVLLGKHSPNHVRLARQLRAGFAQIRNGRLDFQKVCRRQRTTPARVDLTSVFDRFQNRSDRASVPNYDDRYHELENARGECDQARSAARDIYATETYRVASEEHAVARDIFAQFLVGEQTFYHDIQQYLSQHVPRVHERLDADKLAPAFHCDLAEHCAKRIQRPIAYPIETCIQLLRGSEREEGLFRVAPAQGKQKKLAVELDLQLLNKHSKLNALGYDAHVAAGTLKQYLRELPDCLLTDELLPQWNDLCSHERYSTEDARVQRIGELLHQLPRVNYDNLW